MKKILFLLAAAAITQTAFADIGTLYRSKTTDVKITKQGQFIKLMPVWDFHAVVATT